VNYQDLEKFGKAYCLEDVLKLHYHYVFPLEIY
jgi:hypothetical protein